MSDSAIQSDVPAPAAATAAATSTEAAEVQKSARELAMEALETRHQNEMAISNGYQLIDAEPDPDTTTTTTGAVAVADQLAAQLTDAPLTEPPKVKVKIDGTEEMVSAEEIRAYQVGKTADKRLNEATRLLREAQEAQTQRLLIEQQDAQLRAQQASAAQTAVQNTAPAADPQIDVSGKEFLKALFEGDEENALTALQKVIGGRQQAPAAAAPAPTLDIDQIANAVTQQVQQKLSVESALAQSQRDYPELYSDPDMEALALTKIARLREQDGSDFFTALSTVSKDMASKFGWSTSTAAGRPDAEPAPTTTSNRTAKLEQKRGIDNVASVNTKTTTTEQQPESPSDVIAAMKAARAGG